MTEMAKLLRSLEHTLSSAISGGAPVLRIMLDENDSKTYRDIQRDLPTALDLAPAGQTPTFRTVPGALDATTGPSHVLTSDRKAWRWALTETGALVG